MYSAYTIPNKKHQFSLMFFMARELGFEPRTHRLTAGCSTAELLPNIQFLKHFPYFTIKPEKINTLFRPKRVWR